MGKYVEIVSKGRFWGVDFLMILVILGTQDKPFSRLLKAVEKAIDDGIIKDEVIVQAGQTKYISNKMKIFDLISAPEFEKLIDDADLIITHGGAGSILSAIRKGKKVIAAPRLQKYMEHHNDHQKQIIHEFSKQGYILELNDFQKLDKLIEKSASFKPKKFMSNTHNMVKMLEKYIDSNNHISWFNIYFAFFYLGIFIFLMIVVFLIFY